MAGPRHHRGFLALAAAVRLGWCDAWDTDLRYRFRPQDEWGPRQWNADRVVEGLRPTIVVPVLAILVTLTCIRRRSVRPAVLAGVTTLLLGVLIGVSKVVVGRPDPHGTGDSHGGSFPSGHTATVIVGFGLAVLLLDLPRRWRWLVPAVAGVAMAWSLLVEAAHWTTDVIGGGLLGVGVLVAVRAAWFLVIPPELASDVHTGPG